jgi:hypothetical protein
MHVRAVPGPSLCEGGQQKTNSGRGEKQIPFGDDNQRGKGKGKDAMSGPLLCAMDDKAGSRFGRED